MVSTGSSTNNVRTMRRISRILHLPAASDELARGMGGAVSGRPPRMGMSSSQLTRRGRPRPLKLGLLASGPSASFAAGGGILRMHGAGATRSSRVTDEGHGSRLTDGSSLGCSAGAAVVGAAAGATPLGSSEMIGGFGSACSLLLVPADIAFCRSLCLGDTHAKSEGPMSNRCGLTGSANRHSVLVVFQI